MKNKKVFCEDYSKSAGGIEKINWAEWLNNN